MKISNSKGMIGLWSVSESIGEDKSNECHFY